MQGKDVKVIVMSCTRGVVDHALKEVRKEVRIGPVGESGQDNFRGWFVGLDDLVGDFEDLVVINGAAGEEGTSVVGLVPNLPVADIVPVADYGLFHELGPQVLRIVPGSIETAGPLCSRVFRPVRYPDQDSLDRDPSLLAGIYLVVGRSIT